MSHQPDLIPPTDEDRFFAFLKRAPESMFSLSEFDGLLTAVAIGPEMIMPSEWLSLAWGDEEPIFDSNEEASAVLGELMRRYNEIIASLELDPPCYEPFFWSDDDGAPIIDEWCYGFMAGVALRPEAWARLMNSRQGVLLLPIMAHVRAFADDIGVTPEDLPGIDPTVAIPSLVAKMHAYWRRRRRKTGDNTVHLTRTPIRIRTNGAKVGRNAPCPCGSGAKFKRCCGHSGVGSSQAN